MPLNGQVCPDPLLSAAPHIWISFRDKPDVLPPVHSSTHCNLAATPYYPLEASLAKINNDLFVAKFNGYFSVLIFPASLQDLTWLTTFSLSKVSPPLVSMTTPSPGLPPLWALVFSLFPMVLFATIYSSNLWSPGSHPKLYSFFIPLLHVMPPTIMASTHMHLRKTPESISPAETSLLSPPPLNSWRPNGTTLLTNCPTDSAHSKYLKWNSPSCPSSHPHLFFFSWSGFSITRYTSQRPGTHKWFPLIPYLTHSNSHRILTNSTLLPALYTAPLPSCSQYQFP